MFKAEIFKAYDIRGIYGQDFDDDLAYQLGLAYVSLRSQEADCKNKKEKLKIVVGRDMRLSSGNLKSALIKGLLDAGVDVFDIDLASTPTFYFAVGSGDYDGGIMISASHNPKEWNGFKVVRAKARPISGDTGLQDLREKIGSGKLTPAPQKGELYVLDGILEKQIAHDISHAQIKNIKQLKVVVDAANSMGALYIEKLFHSISAQLIPLNFELDGSFPAHEADPLKDENNIQLKTAVLEEKADLGIAIDGDGDRIFFLDEQGNTINQAIIRGVLAKIFLQEKPGAKIGHDIRPGKITEDLIAENGGQAVLTRVGHALIKEQMIKEDIYFAGESSGHFYLNLEIGCFEMPPLMILKFLEEISGAQTLSQYIKPLDKYFQSGEINSDVEDKEAVLKKLETNYASGKINKLDGLSVSFADFWFNVRPSNTENKLRLNLEARDKKILTDKTTEILEIIRS